MSGWRISVSFTELTSYDIHRVVGWAWMMLSDEHMKTKRLKLLLLFVLLAALACVVCLRPSAVESVDHVDAVETALAVTETRFAAQPVSPASNPENVTAPDAAVEVSVPVQSVAERGDAMLFESEALYGTPFDQAVVVPFD